MASAAHWASGYLGKPWQSGAAGPEAFDCWGLVRAVYAARMGIELAAVGIDPADLRAVVDAFRHNCQKQQFTLMGEPREFDMVMLAHGRYPSHVGLWVDADGGGVLHSVSMRDEAGKVERGGVFFASLASLRTAGWGRIEYYRHHRLM